MPEPSTLAVFVIATLVLLITPGPVVLYTVALSVDSRPRSVVCCRA